MDDYKNHHIIEKTQLIMDKCSYQRPHPQKDIPMAVIECEYIILRWDVQKIIVLKSRGKYLQAYLDEFVYKLNRRYFGDRIFDRLIIAGIPNGSA